MKRLTEEIETLGIRHVTVWSVNVYSFLVRGSQAKKLQ